MYIYDRRLTGPQDRHTGQRIMVRHPGHPHQISGQKLGQNRTPSTPPMPRLPPPPQGVGTHIGAKGSSLATEHPAQLES
jgi:hypothetical protein